MMVAIPTTIAPRIGSLLRMLASPADGEALNAARALGRTLGGAGLDLNDLAEIVERGPAPVPLYRDPPTPARRPRRPNADRGHIDWSPSYRREVRETLEHGLVRLSFNEWEREFITSIIARLRDPRGRLTFRQAEVIDRLVAKIEGRR